MKQTTFICLFCCSVYALSAQQPDSTDSKALEREIKTSGQYLYGEAVANTRYEAARGAKTILMSEINREAQNPNRPLAETLQEEEVDKLAEAVDFMRANRFRVIAYIKKDKIPALFRNEKPEEVSTYPAETVQVSQTIIQMEKNRDGTYLIPCKVNGLPLKLLYDTGASSVTISESEANFMLKNGYLSENDFIGSQPVSIASGETIDGTKTMLKTIEIGNLKLHDVEANIIHMANAPLLFGQSALSKLGRIEIDYAQHSLIIKNENAIAQTIPAAPVSPPPLEVTTPVSYPPLVVEQTTPEPSAGFLPVEEATPEIDLQPVVEQENPEPPPSLAGGDWLEQIVNAPSMYELKNILIAGKKKGKLVYGRMEKILDEKTKYFIVYKHSGEIVAILDKDTDNRRNDLRSGNTMGREIFNNHSVVWVQFF
jgi:clan AA aspartic protease (TIGR02281 family)